MTKSSGADGISRGAIGIVPEDLTEENYDAWKGCLKHYLVGHGLWGVVSGKEQDPIKDESQDYGEDKKQEHEEWQKKNALALHAIQLSCGPRTYVKLKTHNFAQVAWKQLDEKLKPDNLEVDNEGPKEHLHYEQLYKAIAIGYFRRTKHLLDQDPLAVRAIVSSHKETALHIAIQHGRMKIAKELLQRMAPEDLEVVNEYGSTALTLAAISGVTKLARTIVEKNNRLLVMKNDLDNGQLPVIVAALFDQKHMVNYLYSVTPKEHLSPDRGENGATLLNSLITAEVYDVASMLLRQYPKLGVTPDHNGDYTLRLLAHKPSAFPSGTKLSFWKNWIYSCVMVHSPSGSPTDSHEDEVTKTQRASMTEGHNIDIHDPSDDEMTKTGNQGLTSSVLKILHGLNWSIVGCLGMKQIHEKKRIHRDALEILVCIVKELRTMSNIELERMQIDKILYDAIQHGIVEFVEEILIWFPALIYSRDKTGRTVFSHAILLCQETIYSLIYALGERTSILARRQDSFGNNFLHLAARLSPPSQLDRVSGAALQMQMELQWFQEVESILAPRMKKELNSSDKTPSALFSDEHKALAKEGEKWMKNIAGSSMIVGTLIAAAMFTTAFTVPGGNDGKTGLPVMIGTQQKAFLFLMASNAVSMFTSTTSILMFLGILTARYAEKEFLKSLPTKLIFGITFLFVSIVFMMASFGTAIYLTLIEQVAWISYPIIVFCVIPIALYSLLQFPLLVEMISRTYGHGMFDKRKKKLEF
nr:uncharacterized protein LOC113698184 isoform X2 [Coffea arabica]